MKNSSPRMRNKFEKFSRMASCTYFRSIAAVIEQVIVIMIYACDNDNDG